MDICEKNGDKKMLEVFEKKLPKNHKDWRRAKKKLKDQSESNFVE